MGTQTKVYMQSMTLQFSFILKQTTNCCKTNNYRVNMIIQKRKENDERAV